MHTSLTCLATKMCNAFQLSADVTKAQTGIFCPQFDLCRERNDNKRSSPYQNASKTATLNNVVQKQKDIFPKKEGLTMRLSAYTVKSWAITGKTCRAVRHVITLQRSIALGYGNGQHWFSYMPRQWYNFIRHYYVLHWFAVQFLLHQYQNILHM